MEHWHYWAIIGLILLTLEMMTATFFAASFGLAALITIVPAALGATHTIQLLSFALTSILTIALIRPLFKKIYRHSPSQPILIHNLIGQTGTVVDPIPTSGHGRVKLGGEEWRATTPDHTPLPTDTHVIILQVTGATLTVRAQNQPQNQPQSHT